MTLKKQFNSIEITPVRNKLDQRIEIKSNKSNNTPVRNKLIGEFKIEETIA